MPRPLFLRENALLKFLTETCEPIFGDRISQWKTRIQQCSMRETGSPFYLAVCHVNNKENAGCDAITLARALVGVDHGVAVLINAVAMKTPADLVIDVFNVDRLDGGPLVDYPEPGAGLMIVERGKWVGGADFRRLDRLPEWTNCATALSIPRTRASSISSRRERIALYRIRSAMAGTVRNVHGS